MTYAALTTAIGLAAAAATAGEPGPMLRKALAGPMKGVEDIVFANRHSYSDGHWYANIGYYCNDETKPAWPGNGKPGVGRLCRLNLSSGRVSVLFDAKGGSVRDPVVHYDGKKILFALRKKGQPHYHLYEIAAGGTGLRQLTRGNCDDYEPCYLPDGGICFVSTRCNRWVNCWKTQVGILYRCDGDGKNVRQISSNIEHDNNPRVLPDGRIIYTRWEYVDRSQVGFHHLWTVNPDGTGQMVYYGNQRHYPLYIEAIPIPGSARVAGVDSPGHGRRDHYGRLCLFTDRYGPDDPRGAVTVPLQGKKNRRRMICDPYPFSENCFIAASNNDILLIDGKGHCEIIHHADRRVYEPRPLVSRPRERVRKPAVDLEKKTGTLVLMDCYISRNLGGVERGQIKKLLVLESLPKPVNFSGGMDLTSWLGTFTLERVLGTVPVYPDGSAHFALPADRPVFFVALDENDMSVKRMQSFLSVAPGEVTSCVGCHEQRGTSYPHQSGPRIAMSRPPSTIQPFAGFPDVLDFHRDIQPILDRYCVKCHNWKKHAGHLSLAGDLGIKWSIPYYSLIARRQVADGRNGMGDQSPRSLGSAASPLLNKLAGGHHKVTAAEKDRRTAWLWIESAAPYAGSYAALRNNREMGLNGAVGHFYRAGGGRVFNRRCKKCHNGKQQPTIPFRVPKWPDTRGIERTLARHERRVIENDPLARFSLHVVMNFSRPACSAVLRAPLAKSAGGWEYCGAVFKNHSDPDYRTMLKAISEAKEKRDAIPRWSTPAFRPNRQYVREMKRYGILPASFDRETDRIDPFATDQKYWRSFWK